MQGYILSFCLSFVFTSFYHFLMIPFTPSLLYASSAVNAHFVLNKTKSSKLINLNGNKKTPKTPKAEMSKEEVDVIAQAIEGIKNL